VDVPQGGQVDALGALEDGAHLLRSAARQLDTEHGPLVPEGTTLTLEGATYLLLEEVQVPQPPPPEEELPRGQRPRGLLQERRHKPRPLQDR